MLFFMMEIMFILKGNISILNMKFGRFLDFLLRIVLYEKILEFCGLLVLKIV